MPKIATPPEEWEELDAEALAPQFTPGASRRRTRADENGGNTNGGNTNGGNTNGGSIIDVSAAPSRSSSRAANATRLSPSRLGAAGSSSSASSANASSSSGASSSRALAVRSSTRVTPASSSSTRPPAARKEPRPPYRAILYEVAGVLLLALGALLLLNALRAHQGQVSDGFLTRIIIGGLRWAFGIGAIVIPVLLCVLGLLLIVRRHQANLRAFGRGAMIGFLVLLTAVHLVVPRGWEFDAQLLLSHGGALGGALAYALRRALGEAGAIIALVALSVVALLFLTEISLSELVARLTAWTRGGARRVADKTRDALLAPEGEQEEQEDRLAENGAPNFAWQGAGAAQRRTPRVLPEEVLRDAQNDGTALRNGAPQDATSATPVGLRPSPFLPLQEILGQDIVQAAMPQDAAGAEGKSSSNGTKSKGKTPATPEAVPPPRIEIVDAPPPVSVVDAPLVDAPLMEAPPNAAPVLMAEPLVGVPSASGAALDELTPVEALEAQANASASAPDARPTRPRKACRRFGDGPYMPEYFDDAVRALDPPLVPDVAGVEDDIALGVKGVQETLAAFRIDARVTDVKRGPVITRYEVQPAPGVRVAAIANLDRDMARSLSALAVRIEAPVPGKNVVGIEVPNKRVHLVRLRDVLELPEFLSGPSKLSFVLGKDIAGQPKWGDLTKMPHMLIAGATNSGKSVCLNSIITSILVRATPDEVKFSLIDPKRVELTLYKDIPHLFHPVVVEPKDAVRALRGAIVEMDKRYRKFAERGVRNIASFNAKLQEDEKPLPYIVIVIDELADLMMTAAAEFEKLICRLAQLARATGIHLIVATQRPSVNVITGVIKANIPARIAFAVASQVDSRTILDSVGAERLIGSGDMLFDANNGGKAVRIQGAYLSEEEVNRIVDVVKANHALDRKPLEYGLDLEQIDEEIEGESSSSSSDEKRDDLYDEIREFVQRHQEMSASMIQRRFEIGYPRAGRIVDQLERDGIVGPADGPKPRKVLGNR